MVKVGLDYRDFATRSRGAFGRDERAVATTGADLVGVERHCADARGEHAVLPRAGQPDGARGGEAQPALLAVRANIGAAR